MVIIIICDLKQHPKVPEIEQIMSTAAATQNMLLALNSLDYSAIWRTGIFALDEGILKYFNLEKNQKILGYLYIGTAIGRKKKISNIDISEFIKKWN